MVFQLLYWLSYLKALNIVMYHFTSVYFGNSFSLFPGKLYKKFVFQFFQYSTLKNHVLFQSSNFHRLNKTMYMYNIISLLNKTSTTSDFIINYIGFSWWYYLSIRLILSNIFCLLFLIYPVNSLFIPGKCCSNTQWLSGRYSKKYM